MVALERMREILELLTPGELVVLALRLECEMSYAEIGDELGISKQAAQLRLASAGRRVERTMPELVRHNRNGRANGRLWAERGLEFLRAVETIERRGELPTLPAVEAETGMPDWTAWRVWSRVRGQGWAVQGPRVGNARPVALTDAGRAMLEAL